MESRNKFTEQCKAKSKRWFRETLQKAGDTYTINIPKDLTLGESREIAKEVEREKTELQAGSENIMRQFDTGATRDSDTLKLDYDGFLSPLVLRRYAEYLNKHRTQADGKLRDSDNWQKGIPLTAYMKSLWRHFMDVWSYHRGIGQVSHSVDKCLREEALCAVIFNASGYLHEILKKERSDIASLSSQEELNERYFKYSNSPGIDPEEEIPTTKPGSQG